MTKHDFTIIDCLWTNDCCDKWKLGQKVSNYGFFAILMSCSLQKSAVCTQATQCVQKVTIATLDLSLADGVWTFVFFLLTIWDLELGS